MANQNGFFSLSLSNFLSVTHLGMNATVAYLILCNGTGGDNITTSWSVKSIHKYGRISRPKAEKALGALINHGFIEKCDSQFSKLPVYQVIGPPTGEHDPEATIWLPNGLVQSVKGETPLIAKIRQTREIKLLELLIHLYDQQNLVDLGGLPLQFGFRTSTAEHVGSFAQYEIFGFNLSSLFITPRDEVWGDIFIDDEDHLAENEKTYSRLWRYQKLLIRTGAVMPVTYIFDDSIPIRNDDYDLQAFEGEIYSPLSTSIEELADTASTAALTALRGNSNMNHSYDYVLPLPFEIMNASIIQLYQLRYKPRTKLTSKWFAANKKRTASLERSFKDLIEISQRSLAQRGMVVNI